MKKSPGNPPLISAAVKITLLVWTFIIAGYAEDFTSQFTLSSKTPYAKEAVIMKLDLVQTDHSKVILFKFRPKKSDDYEFHRLDMKEEDAYHAAKVHYTYLIYPKRAGEINIRFDLIEMVTTDDKVAYSFSGDRDNVRGLNKTDIPIKLPPLKLKVKPLPKGTLLVGNFKLEYKIKKDHADSFEPIPLTITIRGTGYPPILPNIIPKKREFTLFSEKPIVHSSRSIKGTNSSVTYPYALSGKESFDLPKITIKAFDPRSEKPYELVIPKKHFKIRQPDISTLVDKKDSPKPMQSDWNWLGTLLGYLVAFAAGFISANFIKWNRFSKELHHLEERSSFAKEVDAAEDAKTLMALLMATDSGKYSNTIERLEKHLYGKGHISLGKIKKELTEDATESGSRPQKEYNSLFSKLRWRVKKS